MKKGILLHEASDDVGVAVMDLGAREEVGAVTLEGKDVKQVKVISGVPLGHKVAMVDMAAGKKVIEYGRVGIRNHVHDKGHLARFPNQPGSRECKPRCAR